MSTVVRVTPRVDPTVEATRRQARAEQRRRYAIARQTRRAARLAAQEQAAARREARLTRRQNRAAAREAARESRRWAEETTHEARQVANMAHDVGSTGRSELQEIAMSWTSWEDVLIVANGLGYSARPGGAIVDPSTDAEVAVDVMLTHQDGTEIGFARAADGTTWIISADPHLESRVVKPLARAVGTLRTVAALKAQGMAVEFRELADGEIQIEAARTRDGRAEGLRGRIDDTGSAVLEVLGIKGFGCEEIVEEVARAMQGQIVARAHTSEYYQQPTGAVNSDLTVRRE